MHVCILWAGGNFIRCVISESQSKIVKAMLPYLVVASEHCLKRSNRLLIEKRIKELRRAKAPTLESLKQIMLHLPERYEMDFIEEEVL